MNYIILNDNEWNNITGFQLQDLKNDGIDFVIIINDGIYDSVINIKELY